METTARLLITCPDRPGIVATVTSFLYNHGANVTSLDEYATAEEGGTFFMRLEYLMRDPDASRKALEESFAEVVAPRYGMSWRFAYVAERKKVAILVSKQDHALLELLWRWRRGELVADVTMVVSNHADLRTEVEEFGLPYHHVPVSRETKAAAEDEILKLLAGEADVVVLARYMQILSAEFVAAYPSKIINIHHSFLPAFAGARPYNQAHERGVKLIGATAHYVTAELDQGPIIEQDVARVSHKQDVADLIRLGRDVERHVLARAVRWHLEDRVIVFDDKTVVFS